MIRVRLQGSMGNQLFQYAFGVYASQKLNTKFVFEIRQKDGYQLGCFNLPFPLKLMSNSLVIQRLYNYLQKFYKTKKTFYLDGMDEDWGKRILTDKTTYKGSFQDARFSREVKKVLYSHLTIQQPISQEFEKQFPYVNSEKYAVLYIQFRNHEKQTILTKNSTIKWSLPEEWYFRSIQYAQLGKMKLLIISDDMDLAKDVFRGKVDNCIFPEGNEITHFQFLLHADTCIISNSSFAWWGAFLNQTKHRKVIAPKNWVGYNAGFEYPKGIMTEEFEWIQ